MSPVELAVLSADDAPAAAPPARDAAWVRTARQARLLSWLSLAWMTVEGFAGLISGIDAHTLSVLVWASSSLVEGLASITVIWRLTGARTMSAASEQTARRLVAGSCTTSSSIDLVNRPVLVF